MNNNTLPKLLSGLSKSLNIAKEIIPIYQDSKPLFNNIKTIIKNYNKPQKEIKEIKKNTIKYSSNSPQFFI